MVALRDWFCGAAMAMTMAMAVTTPAQAQFAAVPVPQRTAPPKASEAASESDYRLDAARHLYSTYPSRIYQGQMPAFMYAVMVTDTEIDAGGAVQKVRIVRAPAVAKEVAPWVVSLIRRAGPFPAPARLDSPAVYRDIWLVDRSGQFQLDTLTEGQR